jgi:hypothetical protein
MKAKSPNREHAFAGSKFFFGTVCFVCACATICFVANHLGSRSEPPRRLWTPVIIEANGNETILPESRQLEFWTPSAKTVEYLHMENGEVINTEKWEIISNDDTVLEFGDLLRTNLSILGYRRVEVLGQGRTGFKPGWWWTVNVLTNYSAGDLGRAYQDFWKPHQPVFVEIIDNRGRED